MSARLLLAPSLRARGAKTRAMLLLSVGLITTLAAACADPSGTAPRTTTDNVMPDSAEQVGWGMVIHLTGEGVYQGRLLADKMYTYESGQRYELERFNVTFYDSLGAQDAVMTASEGTYNVRLNRLEARGDVVILRTDSTRLESPRLVYDQLRNQIFSDTSFIFTDPPNKQLTGIGFETDPQLNQFRTLRNAKGVVPVKVETP